MKSKAERERDREQRKIEREEKKIRIDRRKDERRAKIKDFFDDAGKLITGSFDAILNIGEFGLDIVGTLIEIAKDPSNTGDIIKKNKAELMEGLVGFLGVANDVLGALTGEDIASDMAFLADLLGMDETAVGLFLQDVSNSGLPFDTTLLNLAGAVKGAGKKFIKKEIKDNKEKVVVKDRTLDHNTQNKDNVDISVTDKDVAFGNTTINKQTNDKSIDNKDKSIEPDDKTIDNKDTTKNKKKNNKDDNDLPDKKKQKKNTELDTTLLLLLTNNNNLTDDTLTNTPNDISFNNKQITNINTNKKLSCNQQCNEMCHNKTNIFKQIMFKHGCNVTVKLAKQCNT